MKGSSSRLTRWSVSIAVPVYSGVVWPREYLCQFSRVTPNHKSIRGKEREVSDVTHVNDYNSCVEHFLCIEHTRVAVVPTLFSRAQAFTSSVVINY